MQCVKPIMVKCLDGLHRIVPCGQCIACRLNRVRDWSIRLMHEKRSYDKSVFLTLTYSPENLKSDSLIKKDVQDYLKRLRKALGDEKIRYFLCGEYGEKFSRPHFHLIVFGIDKTHLIFRGKKYDSKSKGYYLTDDAIWKKGIVYIGDVTYQSIRYVASYVNKKYFGKSAKIYNEKGIEPEFTLMSRKPGIGSDFVNFIRSDLEHLNQLRLMGKKLSCQDIMKPKYLILTNLNLNVPEKSLNLLRNAKEKDSIFIIIHLPQKINVRLILKLE